MKNALVLLTHGRCLEEDTGNNEGLPLEGGAGPLCGSPPGVPLAALSPWGQCPLEVCCAKPACLRVQGRLIPHNIVFK